MPLTSLSTKHTEFAVDPKPNWSKVPACSLMGLVKRCQEVPHYRTFLESFETWNYEQWRRLPLLTKDDLRRWYPFGLLATARDSLVTYHESTGTTGTPTSSYFTARDWADVTSRFRRNAVQMGPGDTVLIKTPYSMVTTAHQMHRAAIESGALVVPADNRSSNMPYQKVIRILRDLEVTVAWCMPTEVQLWAEAAKLLGLNPTTDFPHLRAFIVAGESLSPAKKRRLGQMWGNVSVYEDYGSTETGTLAGECGAGFMHAWADRVLFEIWDEDTQKTKLDGMGPLVVSTLFREGMPLLRYAIEDRVRLEYRNCPCGTTLPTIQVQGRQAGRLTFEQHEVFQSDVEEAVYSLSDSKAVIAWRGRQVGQILDIELEVEPDRAVHACDELSHEIFRRHNVKAEVRAVMPGTIVSHKNLLKDTPFRKPRFLFAESEDWQESLSYS